MRIRGSYFVLIHLPGGPVVMRDGEFEDNDPPIALFKDYDAALKACENNKAAAAYGAACFQIGSGDDLI